MSSLRWKRTRPLTQWFSDVIFNNLPNSTSNSNKIVKELIRVHSRDLEMIDLYSNYHSSNQLTALEENIAFQISLLSNVFMPTYRTNFSPFIRGNRNDRNVTNPSLSGQCSTGSTTSSNSSSSEGEVSSNDDDGFEEIQLEQPNECEERRSVNVKEDQVLQNVRDVYGFEIEPLTPTQLSNYKDYAKCNKKSDLSISTASMQEQYEKIKKELKPFQFQPLGLYRSDFTPYVSDDLRKTYENICNLDLLVQNSNDSPSLSIIENYVAFVNNRKQTE